MTLPANVPPDFAAAHARVCALCDRFEERIAEIKAPEYKEAVARVEFISPFFKALGWDVDNEQHRSIYEKDCVLEKAELIEGSSRSADYAFRRPGTHLIAFYVEAKKPAVDIRNHTDCHQAVRYGWNAATPLVVLTDFEQFLILDSRAQPPRRVLRRQAIPQLPARRDAPVAARQQAIPQQPHRDAPRRRGDERCGRRRRRNHGGAQAARAR